MFKCLPIIGCSTNRQVEKLDKRHCSLNEIPDDVKLFALRFAEKIQQLAHLRMPRAQVNIRNPN